MLLTIPEVCSTIRIGRTKLYQLLNAGDIQAVKIGKKTLIQESAIQQWIQSLPKY